MRVFLLLLFTFFSINILFSQTHPLSLSGNSHTGVGGCENCTDRDLGNECLFPQDGKLTIPFYIIFNSPYGIPNNILFQVYDNNTKAKRGETYLTIIDLEVVTGNVEDCVYYKHEFELEIELNSDCVGDLNENYSFASEIFDLFGSFTVDGIEITISHPDLFDVSCYHDDDGVSISHFIPGTELFQIPICCELLDDDDEKNSIEDKFKVIDNNLDHLNNIGEYKFKNNIPLLQNNLTTIKKKAVIYPNPTTDILNVNIAIQNKFDSFAIFDNLGNKLFENLTILEIETSTLKSGFYFIIFFNKETNSSSLHKFFKQ